MFRIYLLIFNLSVFLFYTPQQNYQLKPLINEFESYYKVNSINSNVEFTDSLDWTKYTRAVGACLKMPYGNNKIYILKPFWNKIDEVQKKILIFHELGHCVLKKPHKSILFFPDGCPTSIMYPTIFDSECYRNHESDLLNELNS